MVGLLLESLLVVLQNLVLLDHLWDIPNLCPALCSISDLILAGLDTFTIKSQILDQLHSRLGKSLPASLGRCWLSEV
jgi:hypothetical protein